MAARVAAPAPVDQARPGPPAGAAPAASAAAAPSPAPANPAAAGAAWSSSLAAWLRTHRTYPDEARRRGDEGRVLVRFTAARDGQVLDFALVGSSGSDLLDEAARAMFRNARLPPFPPGMDGAQMTVTVPIRFSLAP